MPEIFISEIEDTTRRALLAHGAAPWIADEMARAVAWAEARGNRICGLYYVESYCQQLVTGRVNGSAEPHITRPRPAAMAIDAQFGFAQTAFARALPQAIEITKEQGTLSIAIGHAHTCTALGYFTEAAAKSGLIAIGMTNASPIVAPPGGKTRVIGTNPMAVAAPDGQGGLGLSFDQSTTTVALGRITMAKAAGEQIPAGWALDASGAPTTDPDAALKGSLTSIGGLDQGYKGWGLGLMVELLAAGMGGGLASQDVKPLKAPEGAPHDLSQFFILIDPDSGVAFYDRLAQVTQAVAMDAGTRIPGQNKRLTDPVEVPAALWDQICALANGPAS
jgi:(2R)-3-sulfolactate dehydrogenase (NADP+)